MRRHGKRFRGRILDLRLLEVPIGHSRVGIVVPRYGHSAVDRNRLKRRLREIIRIGRIGCRTNVSAHIVVYALPPAYASTFDGLRGEIAALGVRAGL